MDDEPRVRSPRCWQFWALLVLWAVIGLGVGAIVAGVLRLAGYAGAADAVAVVVIPVAAVTAWREARNI